MKCAEVCPVRERQCLTSPNKIRQSEATEGVDLGTTWWDQSPVNGIKEKKLNRKQVYCHLNCAKSALWPLKGVNNQGQHYNEYSFNTHTHTHLTSTWSGKSPPHREKTFLYTARLKHLDPLRIRVIHHLCWILKPNLSRDQKPEMWRQRLLKDSIMSLNMRLKEAKD